MSGAPAGTLSAKQAHVWERDELDWYVEPKAATEALLTVERFVGPIVDPSCGQGNIVETLRSAGYDALGSDIKRRTDATWFAGEIDFLADSPASDLLRQVPNFAMNPPFFKAKGAEAFIRRALGFATGKVCAFVDIKFLAGAKRAEGLFTEFPPSRIWIITPRVSCPPGHVLVDGGKASGGTADWCWLVWDRTAPANGTSLDWLRKES
ncbi:MULTISPECIES: hypothetical protein [Hyphobacterium]|uniref:SAM-dependent methyltransferase n=1 Tax=Hyphobacterium vulgare TaxID=1736751 RepID=A0ABV6ZUB2_9PROT